MEKFYTVSKTRLGADCGPDHELLIAKFTLKMKKVGKTTGPFSSVQFSRSVVSDSLQPKMEKLYTVSKTRPGALCGSDHELLIAKFRLTLKKVGKTTRPFRYDLNQIPYDYAVEVRNRLKELDLMDRVPEEL